MSVALPDGLVAVVKRDCPTCQLVTPVLAELRHTSDAPPLTVYTQDDPTFPPDLDPVDDTGLAVSLALDLDTVPTLVRVEDGRETARLVGWSREQWEAFTGIPGLGDGLPPHRPGCGSRTQDPDVAAARAEAAGAADAVGRGGCRSGRAKTRPRPCSNAGWTDGLPVVAAHPGAGRPHAHRHDPRHPTRSSRSFHPTSWSARVEKVAINAVLAGCRPDYLPVVLAAVEAACTDEFNIHGLLATTWFSGPLVIVNGPVTRAIGMNAGINALGSRATGRTRRSGARCSS